MRNLLGAIAAVATFFAALEFQAAQCESRWRESNATAHYSLL
jgi:hypothetical protein